MEREKYLTYGVINHEKGIREYRKGDGKFFHILITNKAIAAELQPPCKKLSKIARKIIPGTPSPIYPVNCRKHVSSLLNGRYGAFLQFEDSQVYLLPHCGD